MAKRYVMLLMNNAAGNNNKFYEMKLEDDDGVVIRYGRVGANGVTEHKGYGEAVFEKVKNAKIRKGYREVDVVTNSNGTVGNSSNSAKNIAEIAKRDVAKGNPTLHKLMDRLSEINRFQLLAASGGQIDIVDGEVKTALGILVPLSSIEEAKLKLIELAEYVEREDLTTSYINLLQDYLTLIPQKIPSKRGWHNSFFTEFTNFQNQNDLLEQLENSVKNSKPIEEVVDPQKEIERIFGYHLEVLDDTKTFNKIDKFYKSTLQRQHVSSNRKLKNVYRMVNEVKAKEYDEVLSRLGNEMMLWHGTRACNVLSILKGGLIIPPTVGGNYTIAGRMFGDGCYFSDQSSKSLNYSVGYWGSGGYESGSVFMLNASVAMGKAYTPSGPTHSRPAGYDSIFAKGGKSGVMNNEMIVPTTNQFRLDYLCEFD